MDLLEKVTPFLDTSRNWIMKGAELASRSFDLDPNNVYLLLIVVISIYVSKKILEFFYTTLDGRKAHWLILGSLIFYVFRYLGVN